MKVESSGFFERIDTEYERRKEVKADSKVFSLRNWKDRVALN